MFAFLCSFLCVFPLPPFWPSSHVHLISAWCILTVLEKKKTKETQVDDTVSAFLTASNTVSFILYCVHSHTVRPCTCSASPLTSTHSIRRPPIRPPRQKLSCPVSRFGSTGHHLTSLFPCYCVFLLVFLALFWTPITSNRTNHLHNKATLKTHQFGCGEQRPSSPNPCRCTWPEEAG